MKTFTTFLSSASGHQTHDIQQSKWFKCSEPVSGCTCDSSGVGLRLGGAGAAAAAAGFLRANGLDAMDRMISAMSSSESESSCCGAKGQGRVKLTQARAESKQHVSYV